MELFAAGLSMGALALAMAIALFAGLVKGALGFAMPMIMISALSGFMPVELALAGLIMPTLVTNLSQAFRQGAAAALGSMRKFWRMITATVVFLIISAQAVPHISQTLMLGLLGAPIVAFATVQLLNVPLRIRLERRHRAEWALGVVSGLYGGISGVWGPPLLIYLLSVGTEMREMIRVQGVVFLIGAITLLGAHAQSGVLNERSLPFSVALVLPAMAGLMLGYLIQDRLDATRFRRWTLILLMLTGLNLLRRAAMG